MQLEGIIDERSTQLPALVRQQFLDELRKQWEVEKRKLPMLHVQHLPLLCFPIRRDSHFVPIAEEFDDGACVG